MKRETFVAACTEEPPPRAFILCVEDYVPAWAWAPNGDFRFGSDEGPTIRQAAALPTSAQGLAQALASANLRPGDLLLMRVRSSPASAWALGQVLRGDDEGLAWAQWRVSVTSPEVEAARGHGYHLTQFMIPIPGRPVEAMTVEHAKMLLKMVKMMWRS